MEFIGLVMLAIAEGVAGNFVYENIKGSPDKDPEDHIEDVCECEEENCECSE